MVTRYPVTTFGGMRHAMDRVMNEAINPSQFSTIWSAGVSASGQSLLPVDVYATESEVVVLASAPGIAAEDIEITVEKNTVRLAATIPSVAKSEHAQGATWFLHELSRGAFQRTLTLPMDVDSSQAEATFEHGVLRLVLPKSEAAKARQIRVTAPVSSASASETAEIESGESDSEG